MDVFLLSFFEFFEERAGKVVGNVDLRSSIMTFTHLSTQRIGLGARQDPNRSTDAPDVWAIFRALRDARDHFGLRPGHLQSLQAMLSFLKPGHGETVFASNYEICRRIGGIDERTLRRHIDRFVQLGFIVRNDSSNRKRYRVRSSDGCSISFGLSVAPLFERTTELLEIAQDVENDRRDRIFVRKHILALLARIDESDPHNCRTSDVRKLLRRKLGIDDYRAIKSSLETLSQELSTAVDMPETTKLPANDGQHVRHLSRSKKVIKDLEVQSTKEQPSVALLTSICTEATAFATEALETWNDVERHAISLAPMMGIHPSVFNSAKKAAGTTKACAALFVILQLGSRVRDFAAYFHSLTLGKRSMSFEPTALLARLAKTRPTIA